MSKAVWTSKDAAAATGGKAVGDWEVSGLSIDTRSLKSGDLFIPLKDVRDGHEFIAQARSAGAGAVTSERADEDAPALIVDDALQAMRDLAIAARKRSPAFRVAITGSVGKTSLKEAVATIFESAGAAHKSLKSFNNHWGVPLTLASLPVDADYGVFEVGMNHAGELADLSPLIEPHVAVITKIAPAHLAFFKNVGAIAAAKAEIFDGLVPGGTAILNADDPYFDYLCSRAIDKGAKILTFGAHENADVQIVKSDIAPGQITAVLMVSGQFYNLSLTLDGAHWVENAACAVAVAFAAGIDPQKSVEALTAMAALPGRGERLDVQINGKAVTLIDDSYNANPESMRASISVLSHSKGRKIAVLGDMFELGKDEVALHAALAKPLTEAGVSRVIVVGECMRALRGAIRRDMRGAWARDWESALTALADEVEDGDTILVKGSNATGLSRLVVAVKNNNKKEAAHVV